MLTQDVTKPLCGYLPRVQGDWTPSLFLLAFSKNTWYVLIAFLIIITIVIAVTVHVETRVIQDGLEEESDDDLSDLPAVAVLEPLEPPEPPDPEHWEGSEILLVTVGAVCQQGCWRQPETVAARLVFLTLFMMAVLCYVAFSAAVTSLVSSERSLEAPSLDSLLGRPTTVLALQDSPYFRRTQVAGARFLPVTRGLRALLSGGATVLCADTAALQLQVARLRPSLWCQLQTTAFTLPLAPEPLNSSELRRLEAGLWTRERRRRVLPDVRELCRDEDGQAGVIPVSLEDVWLAPALLGAGVVASLVLLATEAGRSWSSARLKPRLQRWQQARRAAPLPFTN